MGNGHLWMVALRIVAAGLVAAALAVTGLAVAARCDAARPEHEVSGPIRIATGEPTAVYYAYGTAYSRLIERALPRTRPTVLATAASAVNLDLIRNHQAEVGFSQADIAAATPSSITALARLYDDYVHLVTRADAPFTTLADLRGRRVSLGVLGSGTEITSERLLAAASIDADRGITAYRMGLDEAAAALRDGRIDAFFFAGGLPVTAITQLARSLPIRLIDLGEYVRKLCVAHGAYYTERVIPESAYKTAPVVTIGIANYLVVSEDMSDDMAYALTKTLFTGHAQLVRAHRAGASLNRRNAINTQPLRLHPGAARYYRHAKI